MSWCCLTSGDERSAIKIEGYARNDDAREALSKFRGASIFLRAALPFLIPNSRKAFIHNQWTEPPKGLTQSLQKSYKTQLCGLWYNILIEKNAPLWHVGIEICISRHREIDMRSHK